MARVLVVVGHLVRWIATVGKSRGLLALAPPPLHSPTTLTYHPTVALMRRRLSCNGAPASAAGYAGVGSRGALPTVAPSSLPTTTTLHQLMLHCPAHQGFPPAHHHYLLPADAGLPCPPRVPLCPPLPFPSWLFCLTHQLLHGVVLKVSFVCIKPFLENVDEGTHH